MKIAIVGAGYVGLVAAACFASRGNTVFSVENNIQRLSLLKKGKVPFYEPGLTDLVANGYKSGNLVFTDSLKDVVDNVDVIFLAVGTPMDEKGAADISYLSKAVTDICQNATKDLLIVNKSTSPPGTAVRLSCIAEEVLAERGSNIRVAFASNPEFLKEGAAVSDFMRPDRIVIGCEDERTRSVLSALYKPFCRQTEKLFFTDIKSAELIKYAANAMLACRISFMNEIAQIADKIGADINAIRLGIGSDARIGKSFLYSGIGYGGSCFPKDVRALVASTESLGIEVGLIKQIDEANKRQIQYASQKIFDYLEGLDENNKVVSIWGIAFKPNTSDIRESPILKVINDLTRKGIRVTIFDPEATEEGKKYFGHNDYISYVSESYKCLDGSDLLVVATEWSQFFEIDLIKIRNKMRNAAIFDCKNIYDAASISPNGVEYLSIGNNK